MRPALVELRVLEGANLYFPRPAVKLTLDVSSLLDMPDRDASAVGAALGVPSVRPGRAGTGLRQRFAGRVVTALVRRVAAEAGTSSLAVRNRPTGDLNRLVVAYPWRRRGRAEALGHAIAGVSTGCRIARPRRAVKAAVPTSSRAPTRVRGRPIRQAATSRSSPSPARTARRRRHGWWRGWAGVPGSSSAGRRRTASTSTASWSRPATSPGPMGAAQVLDDERVELAVTETARGGILLRGVGVSHNDVSVVTNVSADHLGMQGVDTVDQLAEVKAVVTRVTRRRAGSCSTATTRGPSRCGWGRPRARHLQSRPGSALAAQGAGRGWPRHDSHRRADHRPRPRRRGRPARGRRRRTR